MGRVIKNRLLGISLFIVINFLCFAVCMGQSAVAKREISDQEIRQLIAAIQDEIYDYGYEDEFGGFTDPGTGGERAKFPIYVRPTVYSNGNTLQGQVIYKYMPFGEVIRRFFLTGDAKVPVLLGGLPENGFSWTQPDTKTVYADDEEICRNKHDWRKIDLTVELEPSPSTRDSAYEHQKQRTGHTHHGEKPGLQ
jgi:hypothetical protein